MAPRHYNYFRDYDSATGKYVESDPAGLAAGVNTYSYARSASVSLADPLGLDPNCPIEERCAQLRRQIFAKSAALIKELTKYDPVADGRGGFPTWGGRITKPGGHYEEVLNLQRGIKNDIAEYKRLCSNNDRWPPVPRALDEASNRPVAPPVFPPEPSGRPELPTGQDLVTPTALGLAAIAPMLGIAAF